MKKKTQSEMVIKERSVVVFIGHAFCVILVMYACIPLSSRGKTSNCEKAFDTRKWVYSFADESTDDRRCNTIAMGEIRSKPYISYLTTLTDSTHVVSI